MITLVLEGNTQISLQNEAFNSANFNNVVQHLFLEEGTDSEKEFHTYYSASVIQLSISTKLLSDSEINGVLRLRSESLKWIIISDGDLRKEFIITPHHFEMQQSESLISITIRSR